MHSNSMYMNVYACEKHPGGTAGQEKKRSFRASHLTVRMPSNKQQAWRTWAAEDFTIKSPWDSK